MIVRFDAGFLREWDEGFGWKFMDEMRSRFLGESFIVSLIIWPSFIPLKVLLAFVSSLL